MTSPMIYSPTGSSLTRPGVRYLSLRWFISKRDAQWGGAALIPCVSVTSSCGSALVSLLSGVAALVCFPREYDTRTVKGVSTIIVFVQGKP